MLPSQSPRSATYQTGSSRGRGGGLPIVKLVVGLGVIVGGWFAVKALLPIDQTSADLNDAGSATAQGDDPRNSAVPRGPQGGDVGDRSRNAGGGAGPATSNTSSNTLATAEKPIPRLTETPPRTTADQTQSGPELNTTAEHGELIMGGNNNAQPTSSADGSAPATTEDSNLPETNRPASTQVPAASGPASDQPGARTTERVQKGLDLISANRLVDARLLLSRALASGTLTGADADLVRRTLSDLNDRLVFSPEVVGDDEYSLSYTIGGGDSLERITRRMALQVDWRFIARVNRIKNPSNIRQGHRIKLVTGPFHAVVDKSDFTIDLYLGEADTQVYVATLPVGLGEFNSTPVGLFRVRPRSKLINPEWINPRTRERFAANDPTNPIGEHWLGLEGISESVRDVSGYGIHGTVEPDSIGRQASMGCVRMLADDIAIVYEVLTEGASTVRIQD